MVDGRDEIEPIPPLGVAAGLAASENPGDREVAPLIPLPADGCGSS
jgi:hypothetical protein